MVWRSREKDSEEEPAGRRPGTDPKTLWYRQCCSHTWSEPAKTKVFHSCFHRHAVSQQTCDIRDVQVMSVKHFYVLLTSKRVTGTPKYLSI